MTENVIVAIDGGPASAAALDWAITRGVERSSGDSTAEPVELELTTVVELGWSPRDVAVTFQPVYERALAAATHEVERRAPGCRRTSYIRHGVPVEELVRASAAADLLVIGSNKTGLLAGAVYGTLPLRLAAHAHCPVVVVPATWRPRTGPVVVGFDNDLAGTEALDWAAGEAVRLGRGLRIVHSWSIPMTIAIDLGAVVPVDALREANAEVLATAAQRVRDGHPGLDVVEVLDTGPAALVLVDASREAELLVVGTHGRGSVGSLILGSVSHDVLLNLPCPIAVIPRRTGGDQPAGTEHPGRVQ
ncbi:universal stress protein [Cryobacterium algoricola]|uniref:Universal stress protein n=1 Tax=Cryobacterium algoricola TaxID=1259183 RepID=A0ABY2IF64_9MICO|nr:universal stress protein [Cryobacterium algoricola]TFB90185.1 universal stress protein [Cryobacterium algoricola]